MYTYVLNLNRTNKIFGTTKPFFRHQIIERKKKYKKIYRATKQYANHTQNNQINGGMQMLNK